MGCCSSQPVDEPVAEGKTQQAAVQQDTQQGTQPKGETQTQQEMPSKRERAGDTAILLLDYAIIISEASDVLKPMKAVCGFIKKTLEVTKRVQEVEDDWKDLIRRLKSHLTAIESQTDSLEEYQSLSEAPLPLHPDIVKLLQSYVDQLNTICDRLNSSFENDAHGILRIKNVILNSIDADHNKRFISNQIIALDDAFQQFSRELQLFVARKVDQIQQDIGKLQREVGEQSEKAHRDRLKQSTVYGNQHQRCLQGTRVKTLRTIREWADDSTTTSRIFCFLDVAGSGKSTVAKELVEGWEEGGWLVGRFFFSRDTTETMSTRGFCETVSNAFASINYGLKRHIDEFKERPDWKQLSFKRQYEGLVAGPLRAHNRRAILTVDALDECEDRIELLETLRDKQSSVPLLKTLITGRPEADIKQWVMEVDGIRMASFQELEGQNQDVEIFIRSRLKDRAGEIQDRVINRAEGLFIWARIACDLLSQSLDTNGLLKELEGPSEGADKLDAIYRVALKQATPDDKPSRNTIIQVLQMLLALWDPLSIADLEKFSPWSEKGVVGRTITRLGSLLLYQGPNDPIRLLHTTLREFLTSRERAGEYFIQLRFGHYTLARGTLEILGDYSNSSAHEVSLGVIPERSLEYASYSWAHHCAESCMRLALNPRILEFTNNGLKTWISRTTSLHFYFGHPIKNILLLSQGNMYPQIIETLLDRCLEQIVRILVASIQVSRQQKYQVNSLQGVSRRGQE